MVQFTAERPVGLDAICGEIEKNCERAMLLRRSTRYPDPRLLKPDPCLIRLDPGNGRTTVIEYAVDLYREANVLDFSSGLDDFVEIILDGSYTQFMEEKRKYREASVYKSDYEGVVLLDAAALATHCNEKQYRDFFPWFREMCEHACVLCFFPENMTGPEAAFAEKMEKTVDRLKLIVPDPYTPDELTNICEKHIRNYGIDVICPQTVLRELVCSSEIKLVKDVIVLADTAAHYADFAGAVPILDVPQIRMIADTMPEYGHNGGLCNE